MDSLFEPTHGRTNTATRRLVFLARAYFGHFDYFDPGRYGRKQRRLARFVWYFGAGERGDGYVFYHFKGDRKIDAEDIESLLHVEEMVLRFHDMRQALAQNEQIQRGLNQVMYLLIGF